MAAAHQTPGNGSAIPWRWLRWSAAGAVLAVPWLAMRLTPEVNWTGSDFVVFGSMLAAACGGYELATLGSRASAYRAGAAVALATAFVLVWISLAVGIIGRETDPANLMYGAVLAVGILGAMIARGRARGMAGALAATALAHGAVALIAALDGWPWTLIPNAVFIALWLLAARLFQVAAQPGVAPAAGR